MESVNFTTPKDVCENSMKDCRQDNLSRKGKGKGWERKQGAIRQKGGG
jgi:hypothetical protein